MLSAITTGELLTALLRSDACATLGPSRVVTRGPARGVVVPLSEDEQRILQEIETQFYANDPHLAGEMGNHSIYAHCLRQMKWAGALFATGVVVLVVALATATSFLVSFAGFVVMLAAALWFERSLRKMGRAGMEQLGRTFRAGGLRDYLGSTTERFKGRTRRDTDADGRPSDEP